MNPMKPVAEHDTHIDLRAQKRAYRLGIVIVLLVFLAGLGHLHFAWHRYHANEALKVINLGDTVGALLNLTDIQALTASPRDMGTEAYQNIYQSLSRMVKVNTSIAHAYLVRVEAGATVLLLESAPSQYTRKSSPGRIFRDEQALIDAAWTSTGTLFTDTVQNDQGSWLSTLTPIYSAASAQPVAILGITYPLTPWNKHIMEHMLTDVLVVLSVIILTLALWRIFTEHSSLQRRSRPLPQKADILATSP